MKIDEVYEERRERFGAVRDKLTRRWNFVANLRLVAFALAAVALVWAVRERSLLFAAIGGVLFVGFLALVWVHGAQGRRRLRAATLWDINDEALKRLAHDWDPLPLHHSTRAESDHPFAADLDLFGRASLSHLLGTVTTRMGEETMSRWLLSPAIPETVKERQDAVGELASWLDVRQELELHGRLTGEARPDPEPFVAWADGPRWLARWPVLIWLPRITTALLWGLLIAQVVGVVGSPFWVLFLVANIIVSQTVGGKAYRILALAASQQGALTHYADMVRVLSGPSFRPPLLERLQESLTANGLPAYEQMRRLHRLTTYVIPQGSLAHGLVQALGLWDFHVLTALERWQAVAGPHARRWLATIGEAEALSALAGLAHDNPDWAFPDLDAEATALEARGLGHPLLRRESRVVNDVEVGPVGTFLLVTGSNMSGKSTLLRALGVNIVLANAGGPVCASACRLPPVELWTSVHVEDSLERGVSFFMAELQRLKQVVDAARATRDTNDRVFFYLLDEILQGTNTAERQIAARRIIAHLVAQHAIGAVSTHDLALADTPEFAESVRPIHFTDTVVAEDDGPAMTFDYRIRPGVATSTNALRLMELIGLDFMGDGSEEPGAGSE